MKERDVFVLLDQMLEASRNAVSFVDGLSEEEFLADVKTQQAVAMNLIIIGEAATRLGKDHAAFADEHADLPWRNMISMRNRIAHGYVELDFRVIWRTAVEDVAELLKRLESIYQARGEQLGGRPRVKDQD
jgi:uncharacterized protein with HEPN domain